MGSRYIDIIRRNCKDMFFSAWGKQGKCKKDVGKAVIKAKANLQIFKGWNDTKIYIVFYS